MADTLNCTDNSETRTPILILENHPNDSRVKIKEDGVFQALTSRMGTGGGNVPMIMKIRNGSEGVVPIEGNGTRPSHMGDGWSEKDVSYTLNATEQHGVAYSTEAEDHIADDNEQKYVVRRLTPTECERLQGFPDGWTDIGDWKDTKGKLHKGTSDAPRYKALGNSIALPFWKWMASRMVEQYDRPCTMASLFDGIGGFPLVFSENGCEPVWASEIEEFPIAVTKKHFPEITEDNVDELFNSYMGDIEDERRNEERNS